MIVHVSSAFLPGQDLCSVSVCPQCLWKWLDTQALYGAKVIRNRLDGRERDSGGGRGIYRKKSPLNFKNIENCVCRLSLLPFIPPSTVPRRALKAVVEQQVWLETMHLRHEQIKSSRRGQLQL